VVLELRPFLSAAQDEGRCSESWCPGGVRPEKRDPINQWIEELRCPFIPQTIMHSTAISKVIRFSLCTYYHQTYALVRTYEKNHKIVHKLGKEISSPYFNHNKINTTE